MSQLTPEIPFMASLWIGSGYDMKVEVSAETYQVGAHFKALIKAILVAPLKSFERFFRISSSPAGLCLCSFFTSNPSRFLLPARGHTLDIGLVNSPGTPRTTLRTYDTRPIIGSFRIIFRRRCRLSPGHRA